jgi:SAM-dependent methyltransferase
VTPASDGDSRSEFDRVAHAYSRARPTYPESVFDALEDEAGLRPGALVVEGGAGTGIASEGLERRGAVVIAFDLGELMVREASRRTGIRGAVVADGNRVPLRTGAADLCCFAQAWHWLDPRAASAEVARILRSGGAWASWWSHPRADGEPWFEEYQAYLEDRFPPYDRRQRDIDWGATVDTDHGLRVTGDRRLPWQRRLTLDEWIADEGTKSYFAALPEEERRAGLDELRGLLERHVHDEQMDVAYDTWLWIARKD